MLGERFLGWAANVLREDDDCTIICPVGQTPRGVFHGRVSGACRAGEMTGGGEGYCVRDRGRNSAGSLLLSIQILFG